MRVSHPVAVALLLAIALATGAPHPRAACADEPPAALASFLTDLVIDAPGIRAEAAQKVKYSGGGVRLAPVLADVAAEDPESPVRDAAAEAVERLAETALVVWMRFLGEVAAGKQKEFGKVAEQLVQLGAKANAADFAAGLAATTKDAEAAAVVGAVPLLVAWPGAADHEASPGLDLLLDRRIETTRPRTAEIAAAALVLKAAAAVRDRRTGAAGTLERSNLTAAEVRAVLPAAKSGAKPPAGLAEVLYVVMGAVARPDANALELLAQAAPTSEHALAALTRLGLYAASLGPTVSQTVPRGTPGRAVLLTRLNRSEDAFTPKPHELKLAFEQKEGPEAEAVSAFAFDSRALARRHPEAARRAIPALLYIARGDFRTPRAERIAAIEALGRAGRLNPHALELLREIAAKRRPAVRAESGSKPEASEETAEERLAGYAYVALLRNAGDSLREAAAVADILADARATAWREDVLDALPALGQRLAAARTDLLPFLVGKSHADTDAIATGLALARALRRVPGADAEQAAAINAVLTSGDGAQATADLQAKDLTKAFADLGARLTLGIEVRRAAVDALGACGPLAAPFEKALDALRTDADLGLRWRVERALLAIRGG